MSVSSFPRTEHITLLRRKIEERLRERGIAVEVVERGLNQMKCQYRFGIRRVDVPEPPASSADEASSEQGGWAELPVHFQIAQRLEEGKGDRDLERVLDGFLRGRPF
jgi:hypothetical protein